LVSYSNIEIDPYLVEQVYDPDLEFNVTPLALPITTLPVFNMYTMHLNPTGKLVGTVIVFDAVLDIVITEPLSLAVKV
jgi:hypothetical protein